MKKRKMLILAIASTLIIGETIVAVQNKDLFGESLNRNIKAPKKSNWLI